MVVGFRIRFMHAGHRGRIRGMALLGSSFRVCGVVSAILRLGGSICTSGYHLACNATGLQAHQILPEVGSYCGQEAVHASIMAERWLRADEAQGILEEYQWTHIHMYITDRQAGRRTEGMTLCMCVCTHATQLIQIHICLHPGSAACKNANEHALIF